MRFAGRFASFRRNKGGENIRKKGGNKDGQDDAMYFLTRDGCVQIMRPFCPQLLIRVCIDGTGYGRVSIRNDCETLYSWCGLGAATQIDMQCAGCTCRRLCGRLFDRMGGLRNEDD